MKTWPLLTVSAAALFLLSAAARADDAAMLKLASQSGCMTCHHVDPGSKGPDGLAPVGPAWRDVGGDAAQCGGDQGADAKKLVGWILALKPAAAAK
jgi:cytochrome c